MTSVQSPVHFRLLPLWPRLLCLSLTFPPHTHSADFTRVSEGSGLLLPSLWDPGPVLGLWCLFLTSCLEVALSQWRGKMALTLECFKELIQILFFHYRDLGRIGKGSSARARRSAYIWPKAPSPVRTPWHFRVAFLEFFSEIA